MSAFLLTLLDPNNIAPFIGKVMGALVMYVLTRFFEKTLSQPKKSWHLSRKPTSRPKTKSSNGKPYTTS